ncbi:MAG: YkgJ family cysteine cluster protein [bacterium]
MDENRPSTTAFSVRFDTPLGPVKGQVEIDSGPMWLADLVSTAYELTDILVSRANRSQEKLGKAISCRPGCGTCCCQMVPLSIPEALYLADMLDAFIPDHRSAVMNRFEMIRQELEGRNLIDQLLAPEYIDGPVLAVAKQYFSLRMPCPFLADGSCSIYHHRPVACREYNVTSPPEWCSDPYSHDVTKVPMPVPLSAPLARLSAALTNSKPRLIPLTLFPSWLADNGDLRQKRWPGPELFQQFMDELSRPHSQK